jgi:hypothetical protein
MAAAFLATLMGFGWLLLSLHHEGLKTRPERLYYLPYQLVQAEQAKLDEARVPLKLQTREIEPGVYEHTLEIQSSVGESLARMSELGLELSAPSEWMLISAEVNFQGKEGTQKTSNFATLEEKKQGTNSSILLNAMPKAQLANPGMERGLLTIKSTGAAELSVWVQKSNGKPLSPILWTSVANTERGKVYASLSGWFRYSEEGVPIYSKAQLLAYTWGMGVSGNRVIYGFVGIAFLLWISGMGLLLVPDLIANVIPRFLTEAIGCSLIMVAICVIFSFLFPPFHGPDETNHFLTYTKIAGKESLEKSALELANKGCFQRIHRRADNKFVSRDALETRNEVWPHYGKNPYPLDRSPLARVCWKKLGMIIEHVNAASVILHLRVSNGLFVSFCLLLALAVAGSIFPMRHLAPWFSSPVLLIPCIAHYSTVVSNYPFLIGGYVIQMVVLGILWATLDSSQISNRNLAKIGGLLGLGLSIALCSADNAMVTLPFWGIVIPVWLMSQKTDSSNKGSCWIRAGFFLASMGVSVMFASTLTGSAVRGHAFLPGRVLEQIVKVFGGLGGSFAQGICFLSMYLVGIALVLGALCMMAKIIRKITPATTIQKTAIIALGFLVIVVIIAKPPNVPEIDLSRGGGTTGFKYAASVTAAFYSSLLPGVPDDMVATTFWRRLGWQETELPSSLMAILRIGVGIGICLIALLSYRKKDSGKAATFFVGSIAALTACVFAIGMLYYIVLFNVNSRYIIAAYMMAAILAMEGYRGLITKMIGESQSCDVMGTVFLCYVALAVHFWSSVAIINRYF